MSASPLVYLSRRESFAAAHRLWSQALSAAENHALFGPCAREHGHGHNYVLEVTLRGGVDPQTGIVANLTDLKQALRELILDDVDHRHLNHDSKLMHGINPTVENIAVEFWKALQPRFGALLYEVCLFETDKNWARYRGE